MKITSLLLIAVAFLTGCSKSSQNPSNTTIEYQFTASASSTFLITYTDQNNNPVQTTYTGTTWSKTISTNQADGFKWAWFTVHTSTLSSITSKATITVNNKLANEEDYTFDTYDEDIAFHVVVFN